MLTKLFLHTGRKFLLVVGCGVVCSTLLWYGKLTSDAYAMIILGTVGAFIAGNVVQKRNENKEN